MAIRTDQFTNSLTVVDSVNANASLSLIPQGTGTVDIPGTGQNLLVYSEQLQQANWGLSNATVTANAIISPNGTTTADKIVENATNNYHYISQSKFVTAGVLYTISAYAKAGERNWFSLQVGGDNYVVNFNLTTGVIGITSGTYANSITNVGNGWYRCSLTLVGTAITNGVLLMLRNGDNTSPYLGDGTSGAYAWGIQFEIGAVAGTYTPTTTSAIYGTPALSLSGASALGLQSDGSLYASSAGAGNVRLYTNNVGQEQARISHTANAVNYANITGAATGSGPTISAQGSDTNVNLFVNPKGTGALVVNPSGGYQFTVVNTPSAVNWLEAKGGATGVGPQISAVGTDTNIDLNVTAKGTGVVVATGGTLQAATTGSNGNLYLGGPNVSLRSAYSANVFGMYTNNAEQVRIGNVASAVNYIQLVGAATGGNPTISSQGSDTNINLVFSPKGSAIVAVSSELRVATAAVNFLQMYGSGTGFGPVFASIGSDTNIPLVLQPKGTGALQAQQTDSTATGGNARGANAVDWQTTRGGASQVASATASVLAGGFANTVGGVYSGVLAGLGNSGSGTASTALGGQNQTSSGSYSAALGGYGNSSTGFYGFVGEGYANSTTSNSVIATQSATMNGTTAVTLSGSNASIKVGQLIAGTYISGPPHTYVAAISGTSLTLSQVASGSGTATLTFYTPHGVVVGGGNNTATGSYSFIGGGGDAGTAGNRNVASGDWSFVGGGRTNTSSGILSTIAGGWSNTASGQNSFIGSGFGNTSSGFSSSIVGGNSNIANSAYSLSTGFYATGRSIGGYHAFSANVAPIANANGVSQAGLLVLGVQTTDATATVLRSDTSAASTTNQVIMPNNSAYFFTGEVVSGVTGGGNTKGWTIEGVIKRGANAASTALVGTPTVTSMYADVGAATWTIAVTADTTNGGLAVTFTGQAATTIRTVCQIRTTEMTY